MTTDPNSLHETATKALRDIAHKYLGDIAIELSRVAGLSEPTWQDTARANALGTLRNLFLTIAELTNDTEASPEWFTWIAAFKVHKTWVEDGFELTNDRAADMLAQDLSYAYGHELSAKVLAAPNAERIATTQGYKSAAERAARNK